MAALNGLLGRPDLARWCGGRWLDERLVAGLAGAPPARAPAAAPPAAPSRAARAASDLEAGFPALCRRLRTEAAVESSRVELAAPGASLLTGLRALAYPDFGVYLFRSDRLFLCVRAGLPRGDGKRGHAHVDQLGLEACVDGVGWLRDPGSYAYTSSPRRRNAYRSSAAHFVPYALDGEEALWRGGPFDLDLDVGVRGVAVGPRGLAVDLALAGNPARADRDHQRGSDRGRDADLRAGPHGPPARAMPAGPRRAPHVPGRARPRRGGVLPRLRARGGRRRAGGMRVLHVVGARPNFVKAAPVMRALEGSAEQTLVHTGQHYDPEMSAVFFDDLGLRRPDVHLVVGAGSQTGQTGRIMLRLEPILDRCRPDACVVYGDVTSALAAALAAAQRGVRVAHVEAGLRSRDRTMPEERNRVLVDHLADWLLTPSADASRNLAREGVPAGRVHLVGNVMIDTLARLLPRADAGAVLRRLGLGFASGAGYVLATLHRPSNVDDPGVLEGILGALAALSASAPVVLPVHPRSRASLDTARWRRRGLHLTGPLGYVDFLSLEKSAAVVVTDSGGVQEETTWLGVPCVTVRDETERPVTVTEGTNTLVGRDPARLRGAVRAALEGGARRGRGPALWDGRAAERIARVLVYGGAPDPGPGAGAAR